MELSLNLPAQYAELEQEEMIHLDGGWNIKTFAFNIAGFAAISTAASYIASQISKYLGSGYASKSIANLTGNVSFLVDKIGFLAGGWVGFVLGCLAAGAIIWYLGENRVFY